MRNVLRRVREEQGPDAVILSNRRVDDGIEVIAAVDYDEALVRHAIGAPAEEKPKIDRDALAQLADNLSAADAAGAVEARDCDDKNDREDDRGPEVIAATLTSTPLAEPDDSLGNIREEIVSLRGMIDSRLSDLAWQATAERDPLRAQALRNLARIGVAPDTAHMLLNRVGPLEDVRRLWQEPLTELARTVPVADCTLMDEGGTFALIGPTGVGKTTTIAKIAARFAMQHGADQIALVSADAYRVGAKEHLMAFAGIIGAKVYAASSDAALKETLMQLDRYRLILIDTEGRSQRDRDLANRLAAWGDHNARVRYFLTLSAATQAACLDEIVTSFREVPLEGAVITKIDEAAQLGCVLSTLIHHDLPAVWLSDGQRIPEDLYPAARKRIWLVNRAAECLEHCDPQLDETELADRYNRTSVANG